jgi:hypothetical protein
MTARTNRGDIAFSGCMSVATGAVAAVLAPILFLPVAATIWAPRPVALAAGMAGVFVTVAGLMLWRSLRSSVEVGEAGLLFRRRFRQRFVPYSSVTAFSERPSTQGTILATLELGDGGAVEFRIDRLAEQDRWRLLDRLREELATRREGGAGEEGLEALDRGKLGVAAWRKGLRKLVSGGEYRRAPLSPAEIRGALADPEASSERRIGAALALLEAGDPGAAARIREAAEGCADGRLRAMLESIAEGEVDEAAIEEATRPG